MQPPFTQPYPLSPSPFPFPTLQVPPNTAQTRINVASGRARYEPEHNAIIWRIRRFPGGQELMLNGDVDLMKSTKGRTWVKPPLTMDFQVPMFTASGLNVRSLKVYERSNYPTTKWVRYVTRSGSYAIRLS